MKKYTKLKIAEERLALEHDIQYMIVMNRINSLLHRALLKKHQRSAVNYFRKYSISDKDAGHALVKQRDKVAEAVLASITGTRLCLQQDREGVADFLLSNFNPETN